MNNEQTNKYYNEKNIFSKKFARAAKQNMLDGVVCSPQEIKHIRKQLVKNL